MHFSHDFIKHIIDALNDMKSSIAMLSLSSLLSDTMSGESNKFKKFNNNSNTNDQSPSICIDIPNNLLQNSLKREQCVG